jgi:MFS family permease
MNLNLLLLTLCQGLYLTNNVVFIAINGLVGLSLAPLPWMATLPVMGYVAGGALSAPFVARHQRRWGRRRAFQLGLAVAIVSAGVCALATVAHSFWLLMAATVVAGYYNANGSLYRFAAMELVEPAAKERAISWVLAGGILGAVAGPQLASTMRDALPQPFAGAYAALMGVALLAFIVAVSAAALAYGVMNLLMAATPIAMAQCSHPFKSAALVLEWHVLGMFVPSFFTGSLIKRVGALPVMAVGVLLNLACVAVALSGIDLMHFLAALFTLGVGWNFLFIGGTSLLTEAYRPEERTTAQATMDTVIYSTLALTSVGSGALVTTGGWTWMNLGALLPVALIALALLWLWAVRRSVAAVRAA